MTQDEQSERRLEDAYALPLGVVDAALWTYFARLKGFGGFRLTHRRQTITTGSAVYHVSLTIEGEPEYIGSIVLQMFDERLTHVFAEPKHAPMAPEWRHLIEEILGTFLDTLARLLPQDQQHIRQMASKPRSANHASLSLNAAMQALTSSGVSKVGTHLSWPEDDWAWEQVNTQARPRADVRREWEQRLSPDRPKLKDPARSFRHAVNPKRKGRRKAER